MWGATGRFRPAPEELLTPPESTVWELLWSSEVPRYDGGDTALLDGENGW
jgi:maltooligosyltrehalose trehalohydrolase